MKEVMTKDWTLKWWYVGVIILIICGAGLFIYQSYVVKDDKKTEPTPTSTSTPSSTTGPETLKLSSNLVQDLYRKFNSNDAKIQGLFLDDISNNVKSVMANDIIPEVKAYIAYRMLDKSEITSIACSNHPSVLAYGNVSAKDGFVCGNIKDAAKDEGYIEPGYTDFDDRNSYTTEIKEEHLKKTWENIFGPGTYQRTASFITLMTNEKYVFDTTSNTYVYTTTYSGGTFVPNKATLISAIKFENKIELIEQVTKQDNISVQLKHTFVLNSDGNYYYSKSEPLKV